MRVAVVGLKHKIVEKQLAKFGIKIDRKNPEVVISFGGDGTILYAERLYPSVPKFLIKHNSACNKCSRHNYSRALQKLKNKNYRIVEKIKVEGIVNGSSKKKLVGLNEICVHNKMPRAIRLQVSANGRIVAKEVRGDGIVVATPFGSTGYFHSIAYKKFDRGLGIAFNNPSVKTKSIIVNENAVVKVKVLRDAGFMCADNNKKLVALKEDDIITIKKSRQTARFVC